MRVLIFALSPPPYHGISTMVGHLLDGLEDRGQVDLGKTSDKAPGIETELVYYHINPQISRDLGDIGSWRPQKLLRILGYIFQAISASFRYGLDTFYFTPHEAKRAAWYRDLCVLLLCRPFFKNVVLHWHCLGQAQFVQEKLTWPERVLSRWALKGSALSICLSQYSCREVSYFDPRKMVVVPNGIPDPCPDFEEAVWPQRQKRSARLAALWSGQDRTRAIYEVLFVAIRFTPKGLFDAMAAITDANRELARQASFLRMRLTVAGQFDDDAERVRFDEAGRDLNGTQFPDLAEPLVNFVGWADKEKKKDLYRQADCFILPTTYPSESFGLVLAEAMAHGCAVITTRWQAVPEVLPPGDPNVVEPHDIKAMTAALLRCAAAPADRSLRDHFLAHFTRERFVNEMLRVLSEV